MDQQDDDLNDEKPIDPAFEPVRRKLVRFMAINLGVLLIALMAVVLAIVYRTTRASEEKPAPVAESPVRVNSDVLQSIPLLNGSRVTGHTLSGDRVSVDMIAPDGSRSLVIYDYVAGRVIARIALPTDR